MKKQLLVYLFFILYSVSVPAQEVQTPTPQWRPVYHFTPLKNWTNDPNGLIYLNGVYHLYNQQNPFENKWGHMSWGHATSTDLVHWNHLPIAMPETIDKDTTWRFSGCAVWDKNNTSGFCKNGGCLVAVYTADQPNLKKESQYIAYSNDGGMTLTNYEHNPVIDLHMKDFRDPNVFWFEKSKQWIMVVALPGDHKVRFYGSPDLKNWNLLSEFGPQGFTNAAWECPFLIQLPVDGNLNHKKWVLMTSAAGRVRGTFMQYFAGDFDGKEFKNDNPPDTVLTVDYGDTFYAAIPWNNLPDDKKLFIGWMVPGPQETYPWKGQMSIPRDLGLKKTNKGIRLVQQPSTIIKNELAKLSDKHMIEMKDLKISNQEKLIAGKDIIHDNSYWLDAELVVGPGTTAGFKIAQKKDGNNKTISETEIGYDALKNQVYVDRSNAGNGKIKKDKSRQTIDLTNERGKVRLEILFDKSSLEIFVNNGEEVLSTYTFPDEGADLLSIFAVGGNALIKSLTVRDLSKINKD
jgi:fructan beta-fructosidase